MGVAHDVAAPDASHDRVGQRRRAVPAVLTVHPWEIDPEPPRVSLPPRLRFAHYFRLGGFRERLAAVLSAGDFGALSDVPALQASR